MRLTYEAILQDPRIVERIMLGARRERARAMHRMLIEPITRLFTAHAARPHLARQG
jgi:hypothetical protein